MATEQVRRRRAGLRQPIGCISRICSSERLSMAPSGQWVLGLMSYEPPRTSRGCTPVLRGCEKNQLHHGQHRVARQTSKPQ